MKLEIEVIELPDGPYDDFKSHMEVREYPDEFTNRHHDLCIYCGCTTYPECRTNCPNG